MKAEQENELEKTIIHLTHDRDDHSMPVLPPVGALGAWSDEEIEGIVASQKK